MRYNTVDALLMESALEMIVGYDEKGVILYANPAVKETLGYGEELLGMNLRNIVVPKKEKNKISFVLNLERKDIALMNKGGSRMPVIVRLIEAAEEDDLSFMLAMKRTAC